MIRNDLYSKLAKGSHLFPYKRRYESVSTEQFLVEAKGHDWKIVVSPNFAWDGPSFIPVFRFSSSPWVKWSKVHDAMHSREQQQKIRVIRNGRILTPNQWSFGDSNEIFIEGLKSDGVSRYKAVIAEALIRWFGKIFSKTY